jgi:putative PEP-CTERM system histidine kinase
MVHDLKNIAAELELVSRNAKTHINNPDFIEDAFETVDNAADDIKRLLDQLRNRRAQAEKRVILDLCELVPKVIAGKVDNLPEPVFEASCLTCRVTAEKDRLGNVLAHLIQNAQQATGEAGSVIVALRNNGTMQVVEIRDDGIGMDADFVRNHLFKPFDTTKGNAGMGIGMYESREFIRLLGGDVHVHSESGTGTTISLHIPASAQLKGPLCVNA